MLEHPLEGGRDLGVDAGRDVVEELHNRDLVRARARGEGEGEGEGEG